MLLNKMASVPHPAHRLLPGAYWARAALNPIQLHSRMRNPHCTNYLVPGLCHELLLNRYRQLFLLHQHYRYWHHEWVLADLLRNWSPKGCPAERLTALGVGWPLLHFCSVWNEYLSCTRYRYINLWKVKMTEKFKCTVVASLTPYFHIVGKVVCTTGTSW
jgi:hypothetical protein